MACRMVGTKLLSESVQTNYEMETAERTSLQLESNCKNPPPPLGKKKMAAILSSVFSGALTAIPKVSSITT